jgi:O-antigen ligase
MNFTLRLDQFTRAGLLLFVFAIPWSSALYRISMLMLLLALTVYVAHDLFNKHSHQKLALWRIPLDPVWSFGVALSTWVVLSYFWTLGTQDNYFFDAWRYSKLWMIPVFGFLIYRAFENHPLPLVKSFALGCILLMLPSFLDYLGVSQSIGLDSYLKGNPAYSRETASGLNLVYFRNHIVHGFHVAILFGILAITYAKKSKFAGLYVFLAFCCVCDIAFLVIGKMALFSLLLSMLIVVVYYFSNWRKGLLLSLVFLLIVFSIGLVSETVQHRIFLIWSEAKEFFQNQNINSSGGNRLHYWYISLAMFLDHPLIGAGAGAFRTGLEVSKDPLSNSFHYHTHNEYLSQLSQFGLVGFGLFSGLLISLYHGCINWKHNTVQACGMFVVIIFLLNALSDSSLHNEWEGWTLVFFSGLIFSQRIGKHNR